MSKLRVTHSAIQEIPEKHAEELYNINENTIFTITIESDDGDMFFPCFAVENREIVGSVRLFTDGYCMEPPKEYTRESFNDSFDDGGILYDQIVKLAHMEKDRFVQSNDYRDAVFKEVDYESRFS